MFAAGESDVLAWHEKRVGFRVEVYEWHVREKSVAVVRRQGRGTQHSSIFTQEAGFLAFHEVGVLGGQVEMAVVSCM